jgi:hypothetical protein
MSIFFVDIADNVEEYIFLSGSKYCPLRQEEIMEITLTLSDELVKKIQHLPHPNEFISEALKKALQYYTMQQAQADAKLSKWAKIVQRVQEDPIHLAGYSEQLKKDMKEFRTNFELIHDK